MQEFLSLQLKCIPDSVFTVSFLILCILIALVFMIKKNPRDTKRVSFLMVLVEYVFLMFCSTIIFRNPHPELLRMELMPFWNYHDVLLSGEPMYYWEVIFNIILYIPIGFLLGCFYKKITSAILICVLLSGVTEILQFVLHRGLCETDDVIHNTLGGLLGWTLYIFLRVRLLKFEKIRRK